MRVQIDAEHYRAKREESLQSLEEKMAGKAEKLAEEFDDLDLKVAVMGCVVNGPGEAREADLGIAGGVGEGLLFRKGEILRKVPEDELLDALRKELEALHGKIVF